MAGLSEEDRLKYTSYFEEVVRESEDQNGELNMEDFERLLTMCGHRLSRETVVSLFVSTDTDGDWKIKLDEFLDFVSKVAPSGSPESMAAAIRRKFEENDLNKDGYISLEELKVVIGGLNLILDEEFVRNFMAEHDTDEDGRLNFEEFVSMFVKTELIDIDTDDSEQEQKEAQEAAAALTDILVSADGIRRMCHERGLVEDGSVSVEDLRSVLAEVKVQMSEENLERCIQQLDRNEDGQINIEEFVAQFEDVTTLETGEEDEEVNGNVEEVQCGYEETNGDGSYPDEGTEEPAQLTEAYTEETEPVEHVEARQHDEEAAIKRRTSDNEVTKLSSTFEGKMASPGRHKSCGDDGANAECKGVGVKALIAKWSK